MQSFNDTEYFKVAVLIPKRGVAWYYVRTDDATYCFVIETATFETQ